jgi:hypothetical protein
MMTIRNVLHALGQEVDTMVECGTGEVSWTDLEKFSGQAIDSVNFLDEVVLDFNKTMMEHFNFFVDLQASDAWVHMAPEERRRAMDLVNDMNQMYDFFFCGAIDPHGMKHFQ